MAPDGMSRFLYKISVDRNVINVTLGWAYLFGVLSNSRIARLRPLLSVGRWMENTLLQQVVTMLLLYFSKKSHQHRAYYYCNCLQLIIINYLGGVKRNDDGSTTE